jgi:hypothetical protein
VLVDVVVAFVVPVVVVTFDVPVALVVATVATLALVEGIVVHVVVTSSTAVPVIP